jgi:hypothetical protein
MGAYSSINGVTVAEDNSFTPKQSIVRAGTMTNGLGQEIGDFVRKQYTVPYKWEEIPQDVLDAIIDATDPLNYPSFSVTHSTTGGTYTGTYKVIDPIQGEKLIYSEYLGRIVWVNVTLTLQEV